MPYDLRCQTCPFETEAQSVPEALQLEEEHKRRRGGHHRVTITRRSES